MTSILVAIQDPALHPEVMHIAAATGQRVIDALEPADIMRAARTATTIITDAEASKALAELPPRAGIYFVTADPGPVDWKLAMRCGASDGFVIPAQSPELLRQLGQGTAQVQRAAVRNCVGVLPVVGGAGASTLAAALAVVADNSVIIDADPFSGGLDLLLGAEQVVGARWGDLNFSSGPLAAEELVKALPRVGKTSLLTSHRTNCAAPKFSSHDVVQALDSVSGRDVVVDLPRWHADALDIVSACTTVVCVVPAEIRAVSAAAEIAATLKAKAANTTAVGVLRHRGWSGLDLEEAERMSDLPFVGEFPHVATVSKQAETTGLQKLPRGVKRVAQAVLADRRVWAC